jgi:ferritin
MEKKIVEELNEQIREELYSAYLYLSMASYFHAKGLRGFAKWMEVQFEEEMAHAMKFYHYLNSRGERVVLKEISSPPTEWNSPKEAFEEALKHEQHISSRIHYLVELSEETKDRATFNFLQWFVEEQVEEEESVREVLDKLALVGENDGKALYFLDKELGERGK